MIFNMIKQFNWVDIFIIILLFRVCYIAAKTGFSSEIFKLTGTVFAIYLSLHYYTVLSDAVSESLPIIGRKLPLEFRDFLCFIFLVTVTYIAFIAIRMAFYRFIKMQAVPSLNKWGGLALGIIRSVLLVGLIIYALVISSTSYLKSSVKESFMGRRFFTVAPATYSWLWNSITSKLAAAEKFNKTVLEVQKDLNK